MLGWMKHKLESRLVGEISITLDIVDDTTLMAESEELKSLLMKVKEESKNVGLKFNIQKTKIMAFGPITSWQIDGETMETVADFILGGSKITADDECSREIKRHLLLGRKAMINLDSILKSRDITLLTRSICQSYSFSSNHVWMWGLDHKEGWEPKIWCFWTVVLEKTLESPLDWKEIQPVNSKGNKSWIFIGRTDAEAEAPILWPPDASEKTLMMGEIEGRRMTDNEMVGWHHWLNGHEFEQAPGDGEGQGSLACCSPWGHKESDITNNWTKKQAHEISVWKWERWREGHEVGELSRSSYTEHFLPERMWNHGRILSVILFAFKRENIDCFMKSRLEGAREFRATSYPATIPATKLSLQHQYQDTLRLLHSLYPSALKHLFSLLPEHSS